LSNVNHPSHYNQGQFEVIDVIEDWQLGFNLGNCIKYIARAKHKGRELEDLEKAKWYLERELGSVIFKQAADETWQEKYKNLPEILTAEDNSKKSNDWNVLEANKKLNEFENGEYIAVGGSPGGISSYSKDDLLYNDRSVADQLSDEEVEKILESTYLYNDDDWEVTSDSQETKEEAEEPLELTLGTTTSGLEVENEVS